MQRWPLFPHPQSAAPGVRAVQVDWHVDRDRELHLDYHIDADWEALRWPMAAAPAFRDGLWRQSCVEMFAAAAGGAYREFNFSPSSEYAIYDFDQYRSGMRRVEPREAPVIRWRRDAQGVILEASLPCELLGTARLLGFAAVIETQRGGLSYWALRHTSPAPDFHHAAGFSVAWPAAER